MKKEYKIFLLCNEGVKYYSADFVLINNQKQVCRWIMFGFTKSTKWF